MRLTPGRDPGFRMRRAAMAAFLLLVPSVRSVAAPSPGRVESFGLGGLSCATWNVPSARQAQADQWILGYWSATNVAAFTSGHSGCAGCTTDEAGILGEIHRFCSEEPSRTILYATVTIYNRLYNDGR